MRKQFKNKMVGVGVALAMLSTVACSNDDVVEVESVESVAVESEAVESVDTSVEAEQTTQDNIKSKQEEFKDDLQAYFHNDAMVEYHEESQTFYVVPTGNEFVWVISQSVGEFAEYDADMHEVVRQLTRKSSEIRQYLGSGYSIKMVNPSNYERILVSVEDGLLRQNSFKLQ